MLATRTTHPGKTVLIGAVVCIAFVGNLRESASEASAATPGRPAAQDLAAVSDREARATEAIDEEAGVDDNSASSNELTLVPAIYARDPDMRFVYYRNVSKWM